MQSNPEVEEKHYLHSSKRFVFKVSTKIRMEIH